MFLPVRLASISMKGLSWWPRGRLCSCSPISGFRPDDAAAGDAYVRADGYRRLIPAALAAHAYRLFLSEHTVRRHLADILRKLNLSSRAAAAAWGCVPGWV